CGATKHILLRVFFIINIISILDGLIYYQQASRLSPLQITFVAIGTTVLLFGVLCLSWRLPSEVNTPTTPLTANPFATVPEYELFSDENSSGNEEHYTDEIQSRI